MKSEGIQEVVATLATAVKLLSAELCDLAVWFSSASPRTQLVATGITLIAAYLSADAIWRASLDGEPALSIEPSEASKRRGCWRVFMLALTAALIGLAAVRALLKT